MINKPLLGLICLTLVLPIVPVAVIAFNAPVSPPPMASMAAALKPIGRTWAWISRLRSCRG